MRRKSVLWDLDDAAFLQLVDEKRNRAEILSTLGLSSSGGNQKVLNDRLRSLGASASRFHPRVHKGGRAPLNLDVLLVRGSPHNRATIKRRLILTGTFVEKCSICGQEPVWQNMRLVLVLDHINGDTTDSTLENLRLLCPNCNSQTSTFAGRNVEHAKIATKMCPDCGVPIYKSSIRCRSCAGRLTHKSKISWPSFDELRLLVASLGLMGTGRSLHVSATAVRNRLESYLANSDSGVESSSPVLEGR